MTRASQSRFRSHAQRHGGFSLMEILITAAVLGIASGMGYPTIAAFIQEQRLNSSAQSLVAYLQGARARAERLATNNATCQLSVSGTTIGPTAISNNICSDLESLNLAQPASMGLTVTMDLYPITFNRAGTLAAEVLVGSTPSVTVAYVTAMPRMIYLSASGTQQQRCVFLDMISIRLGWRTGNSGVCSYANF